MVVDMAECITLVDGQLLVPDEPIIPFIEGDGIGPEVTRAAREVFDAAVAKAYPGRRVHWLEVLAGAKAFHTTHSWLPESTLAAFKKHIIGIKGPLTTPVGKGIRSLNVALRQQLDLYVCLRPVRYFGGVGSPLRQPEKVDMTVFRENTEDIYAGIEFESNTAQAHRFSQFLREELGVTTIRFPESSAFGVKPVSPEGSERLVRAAIRYAIEHRLPSVTLVHKGNIMKFTEGGFKEWGYALAAREFPNDVVTSEKLREELQRGITANANKVVLKDCIADAFLQNTLLHPSDYSVIATLNLNGDYVSDQLAAMVGGIGIAPGANINYQTGHAIFEATHGTAPDIAGEQKANPCSLILSGVMMFDYMGWPRVGELIVRALECLFRGGRATGDLVSHMDAGRPTETLGTQAFAEAVIERL